DQIPRTRDFGDGFAQQYVLLSCPFMRQRVLHQVCDLVRVERFGHVIIGAVLQRHDRSLDRRVAGHDDHDEIWIDFVHAALQLDAIGAVHLDVHQGCIPALFRLAGERVVGVLRSANFVTFFAEPFAERVAHAQFVVHDQQFSLGSHCNHLTFVAAWLAPAPASEASSPRTGRVTVKVVPRLSSDSTSMRPRCRSTMPRLIAKPRPTPRPLSLVVRNGSKIWGRTSGEMPVPSSRTWILISVSALFRAVSIQRLPPRGMASMALMISARRTCSIWAGSQGTRGRFSASLSCSSIPPRSSLCRTSGRQRSITARRSVGCMFMGAVRERLSRFLMSSPQRRLSEAIRS